MAGPDRKILVITYYWPPSGGPGALRLVKWVKYLSRCGWQPVVLTVDQGEFPYLDTDLAAECPASVPVFRVRAPKLFNIYKRLTGRKPDEPLPVGLLTYRGKNIIEKLSVLIRTNLFIPDARRGWIRPAVRKARSIIRRENIGFVLISSPPHSSQLIGIRLKRWADVFWIADLRDPWTRIRYYESVYRSLFTRVLDAGMERNVLKRADVVTTVSRALADQFDAIGQGQSNIQVLLNGYDPDDFNEPGHPDLVKFRIVHTGNLLENQNPLVLWQALGDWIHEKPPGELQIEIRLTGRVHPAVISSLKHYGLSDFLVQQGFMPHVRVLDEMKKAALLFVCIPDIPGNRGIVTGKLLEYTGSGRPILVIGPGNGDAAGIADSMSNGQSVGYQDLANCRKFIESLYDSWNKKTLPVSAQAERLPYSRKTAVKQLVKMLQT